MFGAQVGCANPDDDVRWRKVPFAGKTWSPGELDAILRMMFVGDQPLAGNTWGPGGLAQSWW